MRFVVGAVMIASLVVALMRFAEAQSTEAEQRCVPTAAGLFSVSYPTSLSSDADLAHVAHVYCGVFTGGGGGGGSPIGSTGSTTRAPAGAALKMLQRGKR